MSILVEIRSGEGGADAKLLVTEQYKLYQKHMQLEGL
jgi:protein subunit release factor A